MISPVAEADSGNYECEAISKGEQTHLKVTSQSDAVDHKLAHTTCVVAEPVCFWWAPGAGFSSSSESCCRCKIDNLNITVIIKKPVGRNFVRIRIKLVPVPVTIAFCIVSFIYYCA